MKKNIHLLTGIFLAIVLASIIIYSIENSKSFLQIIIGYIVFILPIIFISSFKSKLLSFSLAFVTILIAYFLYKFEYYDTIIGIIMAIICGGTLYYYRVSKAKVFKK
jgi:hypothetical protein